MATPEILRHEPDIRDFTAGGTVFNAGDSADAMFAVVEGGVEIRLDGRIVERALPGGVFGEMALIDAQPRSASAVADPGTRLEVIGEKRFLRLVSQTPQFAIQMMRILTERLRRNSAR